MENSQAVQELVIAEQRKFVSEAAAKEYIDLFYDTGKACRHFEKDGQHVVDVLKFAH